MLRGTYTVRQVADNLNVGWGYWARPSKKRPEPRPLSHSGLYQTFGNPFYAEYVRRKGELVYRAHEPMVTPDGFERVQQILRRRAFAASRRRDYAFTGLTRCAYCGQFVTAEVTRLRDGRLWESYHCADSKLRCTMKGLSAANVRALIGAELDALRIDSDLLVIARGALFEFLNSDATKVEQTVTDQERALSQIEEGLRRLDDTWLDGILTEEARSKGMQARELARREELIKALDIAKDEAARMRENANRAVRFLAKAEDELKVAESNRAKTICKALATDYLFAGRGKTITIAVHPLLEGMVTYARDISRLEPTVESSQSQKEPPSAIAVHFGGRNCHRIEPPAKPIEALRGDLFPDPWKTGKPDELQELKVCGYARRSARRPGLAEKIEDLLLSGGQTDEAIGRIWLELG